MKMFTIVLLGLLLASTNLFAGGQKDDSMMMSEDEHMEADHADSMMMMSSDMSEMTGLIDPYPDFMDLEGAQLMAQSEPTVLFFYATWCPTCQEAKKELQSRVDDLKGINLLIVDYDNSDDLQKMYGVTYQHTFVQIDSEGKAIKKWNGGSVDKILEMM
ncbi:TlpA family protein disulfide reductase [Spirochaeta cellobiosiphila]|uniref:TlpA family protein disulfide reductase n=1 Tax=Spirochaeta cellobiosiphila TaxID=504483 RepID=UPI00040F94E7|nr:thioredoxin family protein [Spirochaeta cellobiosiphila]